MIPQDDISRLRSEYRQREKRLRGSELYSWMNTANLFTIQQRQRQLLSTLKRLHFTDLAGLRILDMGCGAGEVMKEFVSFGVPAGRLVGVDLLKDRLCTSHYALPGSDFVNADGQCLPFPSRSFDLVMQFTALSSILDPQIRRNVCMEMMRVVRRDGLILSYDFWLNPTNPQTHGLRPAEIRQLFPGCRFEFHRTTLAPPIARRLVPISWQLGALLEKLYIFNSHYLSIIQTV